MGFWKNVREEFHKGLQEDRPAAKVTSPSSSAAPRRTITPPPARAKVARLTADIEVVGEHYYPAAFSKIFFTAGKPLGGLIMRSATLVPEPQNPHDRNAVAVRVEQQLVGYVPADTAGRVSRFVNSKPQQFTVPCRIWATCEDGEWRARVTLLFAGQAEPEWAYVDKATWSGSISADGTQRLTNRGARAQADRASAAAMVDGHHFDTFRAAIRDAKKSGDLTEALHLAERCIEAAERSAAVWCERPNSWPTEQAAMIFRTRKDYASEVAVLQRYIAADPEKLGTQKLRERLERAQELERGTAGAD